MKKKFIYSDVDIQFFKPTQKIILDLESSFDKDLTIFACKLIKAMIKQRVQINQQEIKGLIIYRDTLKKLIKCFLPDKLHRKLDLFVYQTGLKQYNRRLN